MSTKNTINNHPSYVLEQLETVEVIQQSSAYKQAKEELLTRLQTTKIDPSTIPWRAEMLTLQRYIRAFNKPASELTERRRRDKVIVTINKLDTILMEFSTNNNDNMPF